MPGRLCFALLHAGLVLLLPSCITVGPDYEDPNLEVESDWHTDGGDVVVRDYWTKRLDADQSARRTGAELWWRKFNDSSLNKLITHARKNHPTAAAADARIRSAD